MKTTANLKNYIQSKHDENDSIANELNNSYFLGLIQNTDARLSKIDNFYFIFKYFCSSSFL